MGICFVCSVFGFIMWFAVCSGLFAFGLPKEIAFVYYMRTFWFRWGSMLFIILWVAGV